MSWRCDPLISDHDYEHRVRQAAIEWLDQRNASGSRLFRFEELAEFTFEGLRVPLMDRQRGIRKPAPMTAALSIRTTFTPPGQVPPYEDAAGPDGLQRYKYRGVDPDHPENVALRSALRERVPLIWFVAVAPGDYLPVYPVSVVAEERDQLQFVVAVDAAQALMPVGAHLDDTQRRYVERLTKQRLHQPVFRAQVLKAYDYRCAICQLKYSSLLDAAHILPDGHPRGLPVVPNGLALCKIHHAAFDQNLLGVRPDLVVEVRSDVRLGTDGPMLLHGLQEMDGVRLAVPHASRAQPDPNRIAERYANFLRAG